MAAMRCIISVPNIILNADGGRRDALAAANENRQVALADATSIWHRRSGNGKDRRGRSVGSNP